MYSLRQDIEQLSQKVERILGQAKEAVRSKQEDLAQAAWWRQEFLPHIGLLIDFGKVAEVYELCESLELRWRKWPEVAKHVSPENVLPHADRFHPAVAYALVRTYLAHMDLAKRRRIDDHRVFFEGQLKSPMPLLQAHAHSGLGLLKVFVGQFVEAQSYFQTARRLFGQQQETVDSLKMGIREVMVDCYAEAYETAQSKCSALLEEAVSLGGQAVAAILACYATLGSNCIELGRRSEALRHLREAARLAGFMPPAQTSAFALFQYGRFLLDSGKPRDALAWLEKAERYQRVVDPLARLSCLSELLKCYRAAHEWNKARQCLGFLFGSKLLGVDPEHFEESYPLAAQICLDMHDTRLAASYRAEALNWNEKREAPPNEKSDFVESLSQAFGEFESKWSQARRYSSLAPAGAGTGSSHKAFIDLADGRGVLHISGTGVPGPDGSLLEIFEFELKKDTALRVALEEFIALRHAGQRGTTREGLEEKIAALSQGTKERSDARKIQRVLEQLRKNQLLEEWQDGNHKMVGLPAGLELIVRGEKTHDGC